MKTKKQRTIGIKINVLLVLLIVLVCAVMIIMSHLINSSRIDRYFANVNTSICKTMINLTDDSFITTLAQKIQTDEYRQIYDKAVETQNEKLIYDWLRKEGLYDKYKSTLNLMDQFQKDMDVEYIYYWTCVGHWSYAIMDPKEDIFYLGLYYQNEDEFDEYTTNCHIDPTINYSDDYGWLMSGYEPVTDPDGEALASIGVDINMDAVMAERNQFLLNLIIASIILIIFAVIVGILSARKLIVKPLTILSLEMSRFNPVADQDYETCNVLSATYKKNDEIGVLYSGIHDMQTNIVDYLSDITKATSDRERIGAELDITAKIQSRILPTDFPSRDDVQIYASVYPAKEMCGDFYDFFMMDDDHMGLVVADVAGKGIPAAMFMIVTKALIHSRASLPDKPSEILYDVNNTLCEGYASDLYVTVWFGILTLSTGSLISSSAGHEYPAIMQGVHNYSLKSAFNMPPLGTEKNLGYTDTIVQLSKGDRLFLYTDGVPGAVGNDDVKFGAEGMLKVLNHNKTSSPEALVKTMKSEIDSFVGDTEASDDITMMSVVYNG